MLTGINEGAVKYSQGYASLVLMLSIIMYKNSSRLNCTPKVR